MKKFLASHKRLIIFLILILIGGIIVWRELGNKSKQPQYQTATTQTEITSGLTEGDTVITSIISPSQTSTSQGGSIFGGTRGGAGGAFRVIGGGGR